MHYPSMCLCLLTEDDIISDTNPQYQILWHYSYMESLLAKLLGQLISAPNLLQSVQARKSTQTRELI